MTSVWNIPGHVSQPRHIFVSYAHADAGFADHFVPDLILAGIPIWIDQGGLKPGTPDWELAVRDAITSAITLLLIATPTSLRSLAVQGEVKVASDNHIPIFVVWASGTVWSECVPLELMKSHYVDCRDATYGEGLKAVTRALRHEIERLRVTRSAPSGLSPLRVLCISSNPEVLPLLLDAEMSRDSPDTSRDPLPDRASATAGIEVTNATAVHGHQIAAVLNSIASRDEFEIVHLAGYEIVAGNSSQFSDNTDAMASGHVQSHILTAPQLTEILALSLPACVRLVLLAIPSQARQHSDNIESAGREVDSMLEALVSCAPYVLIAEWDRSESSEATADAIDVFLRAFYHSYAQNRSIEKSLSNGQLQVRVRALSHLLQLALRKRAHYLADGALVVEAHIAGLPDSITIDLSPVQELLATLDLSREQLFDLLARKIRAHKVAFATPREHAILSIDSILHGEFSWNASAGTIICTKLFRFRDDIDPRHWENWCRLLVAYNDLCAEGYRRLAEPALPTARTIIAQSLHRFQRKYELLEAVAQALVEVGCQHAWMPFAEGKVNLEMAEEKLAEDESGEAGAYLEMALSCLHTMVDTCKPPVVAETAQ